MGSFKRQIIDYQWKTFFYFIEKSLFCIPKPILKTYGSYCVGNVTYIPVTYKPKIDGQTFWLIFLALNIRANERETVTYKHVTYKPKGV